MADITSSTISSFSSSQVKASTPNAARRARIRRSSGPAATTMPAASTAAGVGPPLSPSTSRIFNSTRTRHSSTGKKKFNASAPSAGSTAGGKRGPSPNQQPKPYADLKLEPGGVVKLLHKILDPETQNLQHTKLRDLVEKTGTPKSCRNLMQQFDAAPHTFADVSRRTRVTFALGAEGDESIIDQLYASTIEMQEADVTEPHDGLKYEDEDAPTKLERLVQHLRESTDEWTAKYYQACKADYDVKRASLLAPKTFEGAVSKLGQLNHAIKSLRSGPIARDTVQLLREKGRPTTTFIASGIPCPAEDHARVVDTIMKLDRPLMQQQQHQLKASRIHASPLPAFNEKRLNDLVVKKSQNMESELDKLSSLQQEFESLEKSIALSSARFRYYQAEVEAAELDAVKTVSFRGAKELSEKDDMCTSSTVALMRPRRILGKQMQTDKQQ